MAQFELKITIVHMMMAKLTYDAMQTSFVTH